MLECGCEYRDEDVVEVENITKRKSSGLIEASEGIGFYMIDKDGNLYGIESKEDYNDLNNFKKLLYKLGLYKIKSNIEPIRNE